MDQVFYFFTGLRWQDALDILLNAYILFRLYVLFRGTNVFRVLFAVFVLWLFNRTAMSLGLVITNWAMQGVITIATFIVIIIFRNEISNVIQSNDLKSFVWGIPRRQTHTPVSTIAEGIFALARERIGALVVLPMKQGVERIVQGGVPMDARLSREVLISLFWPDNPLHDGAAVVQGDRIVSAGVILPLSRREDLPSQFGTRHRAALGVSQLTDALVIVVSEERGVVTLCVDGQALEVADQDDLEARLQVRMGEKGLKKGLRQQSLELLTAGLICLFAVSGLWLSFSKGMESLASFDVPIEFSNPEPKKEILSSSASKIKVLVSGASPLVNAVKPEQVKIILDLSQAEVGKIRFPVTPEHITLPPGISLKKIEPESIALALDTLVEKTLYVQPVWTGKLPDTLVMTRAEVIPETLVVRGGGRILSDRATLFTEPIPLDALTRSGRLFVSLAVNPASLEVAGNSKVQVRYFLEKR